MRVPTSLMFLVCFTLRGFPQTPTPQPTVNPRHDPNRRIHLSFDAGEAEQVFSILDLRRAREVIDTARWRALLSSVPYRRLKQREEFIGRLFHDSSLALSDQAFRRFVMSDTLLRRAPELRATLTRWENVDLEKAAERILRYLPDSARIHAAIYPVIKPRQNSFVWEAATDPAIFLSLDPEVAPAKFANTVAHELHHIGLASVASRYAKRLDTLSERARTVADWIGAFGEGMAMLAAAGGPDIHPHAASPAAERARWDRDMENFNADLLRVDSFFVAILDGALADKDSIQRTGTSFFGVQGPWYTVGYKMCVIVEKQYGRKALIGTMLDPRRLLALYNRAASKSNAAGQTHLALWSERVLRETASPDTRSIAPVK